MELSSILIVDDMDASLARLERLLRGLQDEPRARIRTAVDLAGARELLQAVSFDLALVDMQLPDGTGVELIGWMQAHAPGVPAVIVSAFAEEETIFAALRAGAAGYLLKDRDDIELGVALRSLQRGGAPIDPMIARRILGMVPAATPSPADAAPAPQLTNRETEILQLVAQGLGNRDIATRTSLSRLTIEGHTKNIYRKLAVKSRTAAVHEARTLGLLE